MSLQMDKRVIFEMFALWSQRSIHEVFRSLQARASPQDEVPTSSQGRGVGPSLDSNGL